MARALIHNPSLLVLDEPNSGLDPRARVEMKELLQNLRSMGKTIVISSHILSELAERCNSIGIMDHGKLVEAGNIEDVMEHVFGGNRIVVSVHGEMEPAVRMLKEHPQIRVESVGEKEIHISHAMKEEEIAQLIAQMIQNGIIVTGFYKEEGNLESLFIMAVVFFFAMFLFSQQMTYSSANIYSSIVWLYPALAVTQIFILGVVVPVRTASAISGEKERQTFDIMMTTSMTGFSIIMGKVLTAMIQSMFYVVAGLPIVALAFVIGGLSWGNLFWFLAVSLLVSFVSASIGILCSSICKKTISAIILSYGIYVLLFIGSFLPYLVTSVVRMSGGVPEKSCWVLLVNPGMYLLEFFTWSMTGTSVAEELITNYGKTFSVSGAAVHYGWMAVSTLLFVALAFVFLLIAMRRINPMAGYGRKHAGGKQHG